MLPDQLPTSRTAFRGMLAGFCLLLASCSSMPEASYPPHVDHQFGASFVVGDDGKLPFVNTTTDVVLHRLELEPKPSGEQFEASARWFVYPPGTKVLVRGALRAYASDDGTVPKLKDLLNPGSARMTSLVTF